MPVLNSFLDRVIVQIIDPILLLLSAGAFAAFIWGVFKFIKGAGDEKAREEGRSSMFWGIIGLVIIFGAYGIIAVSLTSFGIDVPDTIQNH